MPAAHMARGNAFNDLEPLIVLTGQSEAFIGKCESFQELLIVFRFILGRDGGLHTNLQRMVGIDHS